MTTLPQLTPALVMDLRGSVRWRVSDGTVPQEPHIIYMPSERAFLLRAYGRPMAAYPDPAVLAKCLVCERAEPGFIRRILDPAEPCDLASLAPDERAAAQARAREEAAKRRVYEEELAAERARAAQRLRNCPPVDPTTLTLDDL